MSKAVTVTTSISTDTRVQGRYFIDVRDTTAGRNRQMTTRVLDDPAPFIAELTEAAAQHDVTVTVIDESGELADSAAAADSAEVIASAPATVSLAARPADDLDAKRFPELMQIAKLHNVPGRGTARRQQLIDGIRAARGDADAAFRRAMSAPGHVITEQPVTAPAVLPGRAAANLVWSGRRELSGRYRVDSIRKGGSTLYRGVVVNGAAPIGPFRSRLRDAQAAVQQHHEEVARAHNAAALMDAARDAGDLRWASMDAQRIEALTEDAQRARAAKRSASPTRRKQLSALGALAASYRETHPTIR